MAVDTRVSSHGSSSVPGSTGCRLVAPVCDVRQVQPQALTDVIRREGSYRSVSRIDDKTMCVCVYNAGNTHFP